MGLDRGDDLVALFQLASGRVIAARHGAVDVRRLGAATRLEDELIHSRDLAQDQVHAVDDLQRSLQGVLVLERMHLGDLRPPGDRLVDRRVVLHRAGAEQTDTHHAERLLGQTQIVIEHFRLGELRQGGSITAAHRIRNQVLGRTDAGLDLFLHP
jgi:hypothetical protein